jgi:hypothetical protein
MARRQLDNLDRGAAMARPDPMPSTGRRHPIFARVLARAGPAMDAQGSIASMPA